ncbi:MAG TPA: condensation domain-containing protein, partial [Thermoanaerobaculia bacterium]
MTAVAARDLAGLTVEQKRALLARLRGRAEARRPLSFGQERLWFAEQLDPGTPVYSQAFLDRLVGPLSAARFAAAVAAVVARHESLRARFDAEAGRPVQWVAPAVPTAVPVVDLAALPAERRRREADRLTTAEARRP